MENHGRRCSDASEDVSVDYDAEIESENCNGRGDSSGGQNAARDDASTSSDVRSCSSSERGKVVHNHSLGILSARLFDERVPFRKKKYLALWEDPKYHCGLRKKAEKNCKVEEDKEHDLVFLHVSLETSSIFLFRGFQFAGLPCNSSKFPWFGMGVDNDHTKHNHSSCANQHHGTYQAPAKALKDYYNNLSLTRSLVSYLSGQNESQKSKRNSLAMPSAWCSQIPNSESLVLLPLKQLLLLLDNQFSMFKTTLTFLGFAVCVVTLRVCRRWLIFYVIDLETVPKEYVTTCMSDIQDNVVISFWVLFVSGSIDKVLQLKWLNRLATVKDDGTVQFEVPADIKPQNLDFGTGVVYTDDSTDQEPIEAADVHGIPPLHIVMLIVGTRGDVQPFVAIGKRLQEDGHRVRLATHANFKDFVLGAGLEFFPLGGDPKILAGYMVKNKGFLPSGPSEIPIQRNQLKEIIYSLLPACKDPDPDTMVPFKPDAIIANPPAYESLKVPLHIIFTMPWTPTSEFPHPLSRVKQPVAYRLSYQIVDALIWLGIRDMINDFRKKRLNLRRVTYLSGSYSSPLDVPYAYIWSPHLVPKPKADWGPKIDVVGFCFLDLASTYEPPDSLVKWLEDGEKPIYIGFGSLPVEEPEKMTEIIVKALEITGHRGIINKGWGGLGNLAESKDFLYLLDNCPHDWLFSRCLAVVHHGGAGTTAAGLKAACPTTIVPFFGDQPFWGERVHARGLGPAPIPVDEFSLDKLVDAIRFMLHPKVAQIAIKLTLLHVKLTIVSNSKSGSDLQVKERAVELAKAMENEDGVTGAVKAFYKHFPGKKSESEPELPHSHRGLLSIRRCFGHT
ncbi:sterol 3-beta-glucosyltransferase ugt80a2 [Citrus sinensis]|nr:sterol 3-beta-glucosyltransferase ugt80a2 [Citrus sinensis]